MLTVFFCFFDTAGNVSIIHLLYTSQSHVKDAHEVAVPLKFKADGTSMRV